MPAGYIRTALGNIVVETSLGGLDEVSSLGDIGGQLQLFIRGFLIAITQVRGNIAGEQNPFLRDITDILTQLMLGQVTDILAVDKDFALGGVVEAGD